MERLDYKNLNVLIFLFRYVTFSLMLREGHRLRVFEKRVLRRKF
jgi:hypothetical protein